MEDARCLLDVISDPQALNAFLEQEQNALKHQPNTQPQNVSSSAVLQPGASIAGHQYIRKQQPHIQQPQLQAAGNQIQTLGSPMPPPSQSPMAPSPMNHPVGSPLVAQGSPMAMVTRSPQQSPGPQVQVIQQSPSPLGGTRTNSPMIMRQPQLLPKPSMNTTPVAQQQPTIQVQKAMSQNVSQHQTILPVTIQQHGIPKKVQGASNTLHYQPQVSTITTLQNSTPINLQGSTIFQTSTGKYILPSGVQLSNLQQIITPHSGAGQQVVLQNQIVQNAQQAGLSSINAGNANLVNYSQQPSQIVIQGAAGAQQGNIILRTVPSVLQTAAQNTGTTVQNGQKTILITPQQNLGQFQTAAGTVPLNQQANVNLLPKTLPVQNGNVILNVAGQNINLQQLKNLQAMNVAGSNVNQQLANSAKVQVSNLNVQLSQPNVIVNSIPQATTVHNQLVTDTSNPIAANLLSQVAAKNASVSNPNTTTSQLVSSIIAAQSKLINKGSSSKKIHIQRAGEGNRRSPGTKGGNKTQVSANQNTANTFSAAQAQADNILSQAISICNLEFDATKSGGQVSLSVPPTAVNVVSSNQYGSVPTPSRQTIPSTAVNVSNVSNSTVTFSQVIPSVSNTAVTFSQNLISSTANTGSLQASSSLNGGCIITSQNRTNLVSSLASVLSSSPSLQSASISSSLSSSNPPVCKMVSHSSHAIVPSVISQLGAKPVVSQFLNVQPAISQPIVSRTNAKPGTSSQFMNGNPVVSQTSVQPSGVLQSTAIIQCAQSNMSMSTAITTLAASKVSQSPTISVSSTAPISSTSENNTPAGQMQVHLSQQAQIALQKVQAQMRLLLAKKERRPEEDVHLQKLCDVQRKILQHGRQIALKKQEQIQQMQQQGNPTSFVPTLSLSTSPAPVTDVKSAIAGIQNMHNVPAPNVTISKSGPAPTMAISEAKPAVVPGAVQIISQGIQGGKVQTIAKVVSSDQTSVPTPTQVKIANHVLSINLTPEQKVRLEDQLARFTPEQQESFYQVNLSRRLQKQALLKQQQLQAASLVKQEPNQNATVSSSDLLAVTVQQVTPGINQVKPIITTSPLNVSSTFTSNRGIKRISSGAISRTSLLCQQLQKDQAAVIAPNCKDPFSTPNEACRRLLRYHVFHEKEPPSFIRQKEEENFEDYAGDILGKGRKMLSWYQMLLLEESMRPQPTSELVMMERMFLQDEREKLAADRRTCKEDPDKFVPTPITTHMEPEVVEIPPAITTSASSTSLATSASGGWMSTSSHDRNKVAPTSNSANSHNSNIPKTDDRLASNKNIPCVDKDKPKLGVKLILKRNVSGADSYVAACHNRGGESPSMPKDYEDFRTSLADDSVTSGTSDLAGDSLNVSRVASCDSSDQENSRESGGYVCASGYAEDLDHSGAKDTSMDTEISAGDDTITEGGLSQSEDIMAVDSLLHSDLDIDEGTESGDDDPIELPDFFHNTPDTELQNQSAMLCNELSVLSSLEDDLPSPYGDDSQSSFPVDMADIHCQSNNAMEGALPNVPSSRTDPLGLNNENYNEPHVLQPTNLQDPLGLNDTNGALTDEIGSGSDMEVDQTRQNEDFESALSSVASSTGADLSKPEAPVSVDSGLQSGGLDNSVEPMDPLDQLDLSDISDVEQEDLGEQMQNAIESILSLQQSVGMGSFRWPTTFASTHFTQSMLQDSFDQSDVPNQLLDDDSSQNEDDLDAAVQSIL